MLSGRSTQSTQGSSLHLQCEDVRERSRAIVVVIALLGDARNEVVQVQREDLVIDVDAPRTRREHLRRKRLVSTKWALQGAAFIKHSREATTRPR